MRILMYELYILLLVWRSFQTFFSSPPGGLWFVTFFYQLIFYQYAIRSIHSRITYTRVRFLCTDASFYLIISSDILYENAYYYLYRFNCIMNNRTRCCFFFYTNLHLWNHNWDVRVYAEKCVRDLFIFINSSNRHLRLPLYLFISYS